MNAGVILAPAFVKISNLSVSDISLSFSWHSLAGALHYQITTKQNKMKKIVFAFQVFGLMAMLPLMVALEMNHKKERLQLNNPIAAVNGVAQNALALVPVDLPSQFLPIALSTMLQLQNQRNSISPGSASLQIVRMEILKSAILFCTGNFQYSANWIKLSI